MVEKKRKAAIEAILFTMGDAVELNRIAEAIGEDPETTLETIRKMMKDYQKKERGIQIIELDHSFQLCTKKEYYDDLIRIAKHPKKPALSDVAMETLLDQLIENRSLTRKDLALLIDRIEVSETGDANFYLHGALAARRHAGDGV